MRVSSLLAMVGRINPEAWDAIIGHGPRRTSLADLVALNPQPLPPREALLVGAAEMTSEISRIAVEEDLRGGAAVGIVSELVDDWCATPWPRKWPGPREGRGRHPDPEDTAVARLVGAIVLADVGARLGDGELRAAMLDAAERLAEVALES